MKKIKHIVAIALAVFVSGCDDFLGDNVNPNQAVKVTPELVLPNALTRTADLLRNYNDAGSYQVGYIVNAGGFAGFGSVVTYNYSANDYVGMWGASYDDLANYQYIINTAAEKPELAYFKAAASVMKALQFQMLVDAFGDVPYFEALQGSENVSPAYDDSAVIYQDLISQLNAAIATFTDTELIALNMGKADVMFAGNTSRWAQFANSVKLRLLVRMSSAPATQSFAATEFASFNTTVGVLTDDAMVNPGYIATDGKQNPMWGTYHSNAAGTQLGAGRSRIPSRFVWSFYDGGKIVDNFRGPKTFRTVGLTPPKGILGNQTDSQPFAPTNYIAWYTGTGVGAAASNTTGLFKGRTAGSPIFLAAEAQLLMAEAQLKGFLPSADMGAAAFNAGMLASFRYLYKDASNTVTGNPTADMATYKADNAGGPGERLTNYASATTPEQKLEAIITQKYIALNFIHGHEAWSEFRRTAYPRIVNGSQNPTETFASITSTSPRADRLPVRVPYGNTEYQLNGDNVPKNIDHFNDKIFWDVE
jgi:hypothetical protein